MIQSNKMSVDESLEVRLFHMSLIVCIVASIALMIHEIVLDFNIPDVAAESTGIVLSVIILTLSYKTKRDDILIPLFVGFVFVILDVVWFFNKGLGIGIALDFLVVHVMAIILLKMTVQKVYIVLFSLNMIILFWVEYSNPEFFYISMQYRMSPVISKTVVISIAYIIVTWVVIYLKNQYVITLNMVFRQNEEIQKQNSIIQQQNIGLEKLVDDRTRHIKEQNEKLLQYAFFNSHKVRAPLSNILGVIHLLQENADSMEMDEKQVLFDTICSESKRLDAEIRYVQETIHQNSDLF